MSDIYHSALSKARCQAAEPVQRVEMDGSVAFVANAAHGLPEEYRKCDLIYCEPPWRAGLREFERRADSEPVDWGSLMKRLLVDALRMQKPLIFPGARRIAALAAPDSRVEGRLNGDRCVFWAYGIELPYIGDTVALTHWLADRFECVGDPFCGYGRTGRIFLAHGKRFVMSDINPVCIGYIAANMLTEARR